jgi:mannose-1-phosphate guanylyltransferase
LQRLTEMITGGPRPKQFCPLMDGETPLDRTRRRADLLVRGDRQAVVVTRKHDAHYRYLQEELAPGRLVVQPSDRGTGPGIVYPLLRILELAGNVPVAVLPADHYVTDDSAFMGHIERALGCLDGVPYAVVLLGAEPTYAEVEYGWIEPAVDPVTIDGGSVFGIRRFWEKPSAAQAERLLGRRCLWNTFVMVGWAHALIELVAATCPELLARFRRAALGSPGEDAAIERVYAQMPSVNFSRSVLAAAPGSLGVMRLAGTDWSDWGNVRRVVDSLRGTGRRPAWLAQAESMLIA